MTIEHTARVAAPTALALFAIVGAVMSDVPILVGVGIAGVVSAVAAVLAWEHITGWPLAATLAPLVVASWCSAMASRQTSSGCACASSPPGWR
ncbi:hypothetical protein [Phytoactinopolyspora mesophila]|uniref:Uncharacterized protein n=1 Tax=Phytoactinopolyspora mesophila TaxID=2650750 RepID=A0A7K3LZS2_9ACTN|nr:hypothetical protein [Phytoactinopolyspora mesophila]NDL55708.1 hypothetical protein [Phytoactinopolyspora mesophila]